MANLREVSVAQSCPTLGDPVGCCLPGSSVHGIFQAKVQKIVAIPFSRWSSHPGIKPKEPKSGSPALYVSESERVSHSVVSYSLQPHGLHVAHQSSLSVELSKPFPSPGELPRG